MGTPSATPQSVSVQLSSGSQSVALPAMNGYGGSMMMPSGSGTVTVTMSAQPPAGIPPLPSGTAMMYMTITAVGATASIGGMPGVAMMMRSMQMNGQVYMAQHVNGAWTSAEGPASMSGSTASMDMMSGPAMASTLQAGQSLYFAIYSGSAMMP